MRTVTIETREYVNLSLVNIDGQWQTVDGRWFAKETADGGCLVLHDTQAIPNSDLKMQVWRTR